MFDTIDDIYIHIGQAMFNVLSEQWEKAWFEVLLLNPDGAIQSNQEYILNTTKILLI